jgi:hypothetical protein
VSAWGIGARVAAHRPGEAKAQVKTVSGETVEVPTTGQAPAEPGAPSIDTLITWIPGEVIAAYAAIVLALQPEQTGSESVSIKITSWGWLVAGIVFAAVLTWLGGWSKTDKLGGTARKELAARVMLASIAFAIWSFVVPGSWWYSIDKVAEYQTIVPIAAGLVGVVFGLFAEGVVRRLG